MKAKNTSPRDTSNKGPRPSGSIPQLCLPLLAFLTGCATTHHEVRPAEPIGASAKMSEAASGVFQSFAALLDEPGPIGFEKFIAADWVIARSGLINLEHEKAQAAALNDEPEEIQVYFYILKHPLYGDYMIDSGIAHSVAERSDDMPISWLVRSAMPIDELHVRLDTKSYLESRDSPLAGVFLTHLHLDHILGLQDVPKDTPLYIGPGEADDTRFLHLFDRPTTELNLNGFGSLLEWQLVSEAGAPFAYTDVFGDQSVMALHIPGHTDGTMAFVIRSTKGPVLLAGDGSHTAWGWEHGVEPGTFNTDGAEAARSLAALMRFSREHPRMRVHLGHQELAATGLHAHEEASR